LQSKKKNKKRKGACRRSEKTALFFKRGTIALLFVALIAAAVLGLKTLSQQFNVDEIMISGNYHLDRDDILGSIRIHKGHSLWKLHFEDIENRLKENPWIKKVAFRKQYPDRLVIKIEEAEPKALLSIKKGLYLIDREGSILERIQGETVPFIPVIKNINTKNRKGISEALKLVEVLTRKNDFMDSESIEIGLESYGLSVKIDGELIKVGYGRYGEKFERWRELEPEIRKRGVPIKYVDLRFKDSVIIKPMRENRGDRSS